MCVRTVWAEKTRLNLTFSLSVYKLNLCVSIAIILTIGIDDHSFAWACVSFLLDSESMFIATRY